MQIRMSWARAFEGVSVLVLVLWSWVLVAERAFKTGGGAGRVLVPPPVLSAGQAHRWWCQLVARPVEAP